MLDHRGAGGWLAAGALAVSTLACAITPSTTPTEPGPESLFAFTPTSIQEMPPPGATPAPNAGQQAGAFTVAVIVDQQSEPVSRPQAEQLMDEAGRFLQQLTSINLVMIDFVEEGAGGSVNDLASRYVSSHPDALPNGLVIFSYGDGGQAKVSGGYGYALPGPAGYRNGFVSPITGEGQIYVAVVHFNHKYAPCGYGDADTVQSATSLGGECRNQPGTACLEHNGYSICSDSLPHLYASTPTYFAASTIIHQLMHPFSPGGDGDHYSTPECNARMGYPEQFYDLQEAQYHNDLCPYVYEEFVKSYRP